MPSYLSNLLTTTTSRYASLKSLLPTNSEQDGDTEDDTHICRVLRAYYIEKGRPFPPWLPPDPKAPQPVIQPVYTGPPVGAGYGNLQNAGTASKLGSLWDNQPAPPPANGPQSLRAGRTGVTSNALRSGRPDPYSRSQQSNTYSEPAVQARPLPSQRAGSHQAAGRTDNSLARTGSGSSVGSGTGTGSAQDRLKARLWGAAKSAQSSSQTGPQRTTAEPSGFERGVPAGGYGGPTGRYEDRSASMGSSTSGRSERPFVAATAPWASNEDEFMGGGYSGGGGSGRRPGLPNGPRGMR